MTSNTKMSYWSVLEVCSGSTGLTDADKMVLSNCNTPLPTSILHRLRKSCVPLYLLGKEFPRLASTGYVSVCNSVLSPPFCSICHQVHIQGSSGEVVPVCARLTIKACTEALCCRGPVQDPDVVWQDSVQHLHIR